MTVNPDGYWMDRTKELELSKIFLRGKTGPRFSGICSNPMEHPCFFCCSSSKLDVRVIPIVARDRFIPSLCFTGWNEDDTRSSHIHQKGHVLPTKYVNTQIS